MAIGRHIWPIMSQAPIFLAMSATLDILGAYSSQCHPTTGGPCLQYTRIYQSFWEARRNEPEEQEPEVGAISDPHDTAWLGGMPTCKPCRFLNGDQQVLSDGNMFWKSPRQFDNPFAVHVHLRRLIRRDMSLETDNSRSNAEAWMSAPKCQEVVVTVIQEQDCWKSQICLQGAQAKVDARC